MSLIWREVSFCALWMAARRWFLLPLDVLLVGTFPLLTPSPVVLPGPRIVLDVVAVLDSLLWSLPLLEPPLDVLPPTNMLSLPLERSPPSRSP